MEKQTKPKNGYDRLKVKYDVLQQELTNEKNAHESDIKRMAELADDLMAHMGLIRRWLWVTFRADTFIG